MSVVVDRTGPAAGTVASLSKLKAVILLGGSMRPARLAASIGRPVFDLPLQSELTLLDRWCHEVQQLGRFIANPALSVRVMVDHSAPDSQLRQTRDDGSAPLMVEKDPLDYRGTGGVLHDLAAGMADDDLLLVSNAAQLLLTPLAEMAGDLAAAHADISLSAHADGTPCGMFLVRCGALRCLPESGFVDMKEQALPTVAQSHRVIVIQYPQLTALPVRTLADYNAALRSYYQRAAGLPAVAAPYAEEWAPTFALVEKGATVAQGARLHDSVVLSGGRVEAGAVLVRSIVCPGGVVKRGQTIVDDLATAGRHA